jgi:branched-chain amino acid aminotransferase
MNKVFLNDRLMDEDQASVSVADGGLLYGAGLFETLRSSGGAVFRLDDHLARLFASAARLSIDPTFDAAYVAEAIDGVLKANGLQEARLRVTVTTGPVSSPEEARRPTLLVAATALQSYPDEYYNKGVRVILCPYRQNPSDPLTGHKSTSYFPRMLALREAIASGAAEALWFTPDGTLAEGCVSNVLLIKAGAIATPPLSTPVLPGIARKTVAEIAQAASIEWSERPLTIDDLLAADEVCVTNVIMKVLPVTSVERHTVGEGRVGDVSRRLLTAFNERIEEQSRRQR